ncbi:MAG: OmpA family protein [Saprospiraceae bacterium]|jgi:chemotaxis protein MotB|nr:OmpA family protein [Saprospiraceae bacterium]
MRPYLLSFLLLAVGLSMTSCVSKKQYALLQKELETANSDLGKCGVSLNDYMARLTFCEQELRLSQTTGQARQEQLADLRSQLADCKALRDKQLSQVGDLTVLSQSANANINETLRQLEGKDKYIRLLQAAKTKADSINLALSVNLKTVLKDGIEDQDVEVKVDKTVVFINLSDKMLFESGSAKITSKADAVLGKIAQIIASRPDMEVMVEGYTDNVPIKTACFDDNWDLSVKRSTSVVRALQTTHKVDPNLLIAAGRGEYNALASNSTAEGRSTNRRTRIIIMPKLDQFYDLLNPNLAPK